MEGQPNSDTQSEKPTESTNQTDEVSEAIKVYTADDKGKVVIPQGTPVHVATALKLEQQRRNSNSNYSKERSRADQAEAQVVALQEQMANLASPAGFTTEQATELEELKFTDPDAWFIRKSAIEKANQSQAQTRVSEAVQQATNNANTAYTAKVAKSRDETIGEMLLTHNTLNPETPITVDMLNLNIPPMLVNQYNSGEVDAPTFLGKVSKFLYADRVIHTEQVLGQPSLGDGQSSVAPSDKANQVSAEELYANF